jgi:acyl-CoA dehydrogenase
MSESQSLLLDSATRAFAEIGRDDDFARAWETISALGFEGLLISEADGGFGGDWSDAFAVVRAAGAHALPVPLGEAVVTAKLAAASGLQRPSGLVTLAASAKGDVVDGRFTGQVDGAPWGGDAVAVLFDIGDSTVLASTQDASVERRANPAGEARAVLKFEAAPVSSAKSALSVLHAGAFIRVAQIAGALDAALALSIQYANERQQFGKPIGKFQAVQQSLAVFAEEAGAVNCAGQAAASALDAGDASFEIAAAKLRANIAADLGAATAHQVHGAIGFTQEHALQHLTRRLISWRSEFGGERLWGEYLGKIICARGADAFWPDLTARGDALRGQA